MSTAVTLGRARRRSKCFSCTDFIFALASAMTQAVYDCGRRVSDFEERLTWWINVSIFGNKKDNEFDSGRNHLSTFVRKPKKALIDQVQKPRKAFIEQEWKPRNPCKRFQSAAFHQAHKRLIKTKFGFRLLVWNSSTSFISRKQQLQRIISSKAEEVPSNRSSSDEHVEHVAPHETFWPDRSLDKALFLKPNSGLTGH